MKNVVNVKKLAECHVTATSRQMWYFELGRLYQLLTMIDQHSDVLEFCDEERYLNDCLKLWFEYYGVGK